MTKLKSFLSIASLVIVFTSGAFAASEVYIERVFDDPDNGEYIDRIVVPASESYKLPNNYVSVSDQASESEICYGHVNVNGSRNVFLAARNLANARDAVVFSPSGQRFELDKYQALTGPLNEELMGLVDLEEMGCDGVLALFAPATGIYKAGLVSKVLIGVAGAALIAAALDDGDSDSDEATDEPETPSTPPVDRPSSGGGGSGGGGTPNLGSQSTGSPSTGSPSTMASPST